MHFINTSFFRSIIIFASATFLLAACAGKAAIYKGDRVIQRNYCILLKDGNQEGVWKTRDFAVNYKYTKTGNTLDFSGTAGFIGGIGMGFHWIDQLSLRLLLLNNQGVVLDDSEIYNEIRKQMDSIPTEFESKIQLPEGTEMISFAYDGELMGAAAADVSTFSIRFSPTK
jgi:hypothetical protein